MSKDYLANLIAISKRLKLNPQYGPSNRRSIPGFRRKVTSLSNLCDIVEIKDESADEALHGRNRELSKPESKDLKGMHLSETLAYVIKTKEEIQKQDQELAEQFLKIYSLIQQLKVRESCLIHQDLLDDVFHDTSEAKNLPNVCDVPIQKRNSHSLKMCGVTKMNICSKRFSCS